MVASAFMCDEIVESYDEQKKKTIPTNLNEKKAIFKTQFLLITITLLMAASIYCFLIKYRGKEKHLLPFHVRNNELKEIMY